MRTSCLEVELLRSTKLHLLLLIASLGRNSTKTLLIFKNYQATIERKRLSRKFRLVNRAKMVALPPRENVKMPRIEASI